jgi:hypothetical protein
VKTKKGTVAIIIPLSLVTLASAANEANLVDAARK